MECTDRWITKTPIVLSLRYKQMGTYNQYKVWFKSQVSDKQVSSVPRKPHNREKLKTTHRWLRNRLSWRRRLYSLWYTQPPHGQPSSQRDDTVILGVFSQSGTITYMHCLVTSILYSFQSHSLHLSPHCSTTSTTALYFFIMPSKHSIFYT